MILFHLFSFFLSQSPSEIQKPIVQVTSGGETAGASEEGRCFCAFEIFDIFIYFDIGISIVFVFIILFFHWKKGVTS